MNTPSKKLFEAFQLVSKIFLSVDSEKSHEYTFEKNSLKLFGYFELFLSAYRMILNNLGLVDLSLELDLFLW